MASLPFSDGVKVIYPKSYHEARLQRVCWLTFPFSSFVFVFQDLEHSLKALLPFPSRFTFFSCISSGFPYLLTIYHPIQTTRLKTLHKELGKTLSHNPNYQKAFVKSAIALSSPHEEVAVDCSIVPGNSKGRIPSMHPLHGIDICINIISTVEKS